jgi:hypothetical protein
MRKSVFVLLAALFAGFTVFPYFSCEVSTEEPIVISTFPLESGGIIYGDWTPVKIGFSDTMVETDAAYLAKAVSVWNHNHVAVLGTVAWEEDAIYFSPLEKWKTGEKYICRINGVFSAQDGRVVSIKTELVFFAIADIEIALPVPPEVTEVFLLRKIEADNYEDLVYDADEYWNNVITGECGLRILFDQEMDLSEPKRSLRMEPYRDYAVKVIDNKTLEVYFKAESEPVKKMSFTVKEDMHTITGEELKQDYTFDFTEWKNDFEVTIIVLSSAEYYDADSKLPAELLDDEWFEVGAMTGEEVREIYFTYQFNYQVDLTTAMGILSEIKLVADDTKIENAPSLGSVKLKSPNYEQIWIDMEFDPMWNDPYCYIIKIPGGIDGISDDYGHYLKDDITVKLHVVDWDLIDPMV